MAESGKLSLARTRFDVASMAGYTEGQRASGYAWVKRMIKIGRLTEEFDCIGKYGKAEYRYYYNPPKDKKKAKVEKVEPEQVVVKQEVEQEVEQVENKTIVSIYHGETTIAIEGVSGDDLIAIIKAITN